jgi:hypothetical protein
MLVLACNSGHYQFFNMLWQFYLNTITVLKYRYQLTTYEEPGNVAGMRARLRTWGSEVRILAVEDCFSLTQNI